MSVVGWIGLGSIGLPMAQRLAAAGHVLHTWSRHPQAAAPLLEAGAQWHDDPATLAAACDTVFTCVGGPDDGRCAITEEHRQTVSGHHRTHPIRLPGNGRIGLRFRQSGIGVGDRHAVHLLQPQRRSLQAGGQQGAVVSHCRRRIAHVAGEVQPRIRPLADAASPCGGVRPHPRRRGPVRFDQIKVQARSPHMKTGKPRQSACP
jgi:hypothetical protein